MEQLTADFDGGQLGPCTRCGRPATYYLGDIYYKDENENIYCHECGTAAKGAKMNKQEQIAALQEPPPPTQILSKPEVGRGALYLSADYVDHKANEIFGPDGWSYEVISAAIQEDLGLAVAKVQVTIVWADGSYTTRTDVGGRPPSLPKNPSPFGTGEAWEHALKAAATDARKNALRSLGPALGLDLEGKINWRKHNRKKAQKPQKTSVPKNQQALKKPKAKAETKADPATGEMPIGDDATAFWSLYNEAGQQAGIERHAAADLAAEANGDKEAWAEAIRKLWEMILEARSQAHS